MKCSNCSETVKPAVALDIDGTLGDYHDNFLEFAEGWLGFWRARDYCGGERFRDWFTKTYGVDLTTFRTIKLAYRQGGMKRTMLPYAGAADLTNRLRKEGIEVWLTTSRPWERFDRIDPDTREWLRRYEIEFDGLLYSGSKLADYAKIIDPGRSIAVVDDQIHNLAEATQRCLGAPILRRTMWNSGCEWWGAFVENLTELQGEILNQNNFWKERVAVS